MTSARKRWTVRPPDLPHVLADAKMFKLTRDLVSTALEGGSNYWYRIDGRQLPMGTTYADFKEGGRLQKPDDYYHPLTLIATTPGGAIFVRDMEGEKEPYSVGLDEFDFAWALLSRAHPRLYQKLVADMEYADYDAEDADVFFQLAVLGEHVYG